MMLSNRSIAQWRRWARSAEERVEAGRIVVEGVRPFHEALRAGMAPVQVVVRDEGVLEGLPPELISLAEVNRRAVERIATTTSPPPLVALFPMPIHRLETMKGSRFLVLDGIQHPGNAGAMVRTAHWFGLDGVLLWGGVDAWHPRMISGSAGAVFHLPTVRLDRWEALKKWVEQRRLPVWIAHMKGTLLEEIQPPPKRWALVMGSEGHGVASQWNEIEVQRVRVGGCRPFESLNVAVAAGIIMHAWRPCSR